MSILSLTPGADLTLDPTESESTTQDMQGIATLEAAASR